MSFYGFLTFMSVGKQCVFRVDCASCFLFFVVENNKQWDEMHSNDKWEMQTDIWMAFWE